MIINRVWSMPNKNTFEIKPIKELISKYYTGGIVIDGFANSSKIATITNDLDTKYDTDYHLDAIDFFKLFKDGQVDMVLYDPPFCYDEETEVFTEEGWKYFKDLTIKDKIATLNTDNNLLQYQEPTEIITKEYNGIMYSIESQSINLLVTPNHRMWTKQSFYGKYKVKYAEDLFTHSKREWFQKSCDYVGVRRDYFILPSIELLSNNKYGEKGKPDKYIPMEIWLKFLGLYLSEGYCKKSSNNKYKYTISIAQKKPEGRKYIEQVLKELGYKFHISPNDYRIQDKQLWTYLMQFGSSNEKYIPKDIKNLSKEQLIILLEALMVGDGTQKRYPKFNKKAQKTYHYDINHYFTSSKQLMNDICEIGIKCGYGITITENKKENYNIIYKIHFLKAKHFSVKKENFNRIDNFNGNIYCVTVPNGIILVKRKGRTCWCGNSPRQISECYKKLDKSVSWTNTQSSYWSNHKKEFSRIVKKDGIVITCGWNSGGIGKKYGFEILEILLVPHGGSHNDTIVVVEKKIN